jgi:hypothetical protein
VGMPQLRRRHRGCRTGCAGGVPPSTGARRGLPGGNGARTQGCAPCTRRGDRSRGRSGPSSVASRERGGGARRGGGGRAGTVRCPGAGPWGRAGGGRVPGAGDRAAPAGRSAAPWTNWNAPPSRARVTPRETDHPGDRQHLIAPVGHRGPTRPVDDGTSQVELAERVATRGRQQRDQQFTGHVGAARPRSRGQRRGAARGDWGGH